MDSQGHCWKWGVDTVVEIGANRQSCDPSTMLLFKLVLDVVHAIAVGCADRKMAVSEAESGRAACRP
jgi:hypothetical protein